MRRTGPALPSLDYRPSSSGEAWHVAAMLAVGAITVMLVVALWLL